MFDLRRTLLAGCLAATLPLAGCNYTGMADTRVKDEQTIRILDGKWSIAAGEHNLDGVVAPYADDAVLLPANAFVANTPSAIRASWQGTFQTLTAISWEITTIKIARSGDLAYLTGKWSAMPKGSSSQITGKMLEVWGKQTDGTWKCIADTYNDDAPAK
ncbi:MAG: DUF4440 domain-containing protein [Acidobacteriaceae bacterium]|nr:DUF4440 domain-containing protein [Acidobacteriaceae bacterium]